MNSKDIEETIEPYQVTPGVWMVPCRVDQTRKVYTPSTRPFKNVKKTTKSYSRQSWNEDEDQELTEIIDELGPQHWSRVAAQLNLRLHNGLPIRLGKQCRERWLGTLDPEIQKSEWTNEEDSILISQQMLHGNKWSTISEHLPGRTENQTKNRWRKLEKLAKTERKRMRRQKNYKSINFLQPWVFFGWPNQF
jgi:myb proto-oncogene protein